MALTTDATPRIHLTPAQVLQDEHRMKRLKAALSDGIFTYAFEADAINIMEECLKVCGGSSDTLSHVLQTKFFIDHTPFYWTLRSRHSRSGVSPLFAQFLSVCEELTKDTQEVIMDALYKKYDSELYVAVKDKLAHVQTHEAYNDSFFKKSEDRLIVTAERDNTDWHVYFKIPKFLHRLAVDGEVWFEFLAHETLFRLTATLLEPDHQFTYSRWQFTVEEIRSRFSAFAMHYETYCWKARMFLPLTKSYNGYDHVPVSTTSFPRATKDLGIMSVRLNPTPDDPYQWTIDALIASGGDVSGTLTISSRARG